MWIADHALHNWARGLSLTFVTAPTVPAFWSELGISNRASCRFGSNCSPIGLSFSTPFSDKPCNRTRMKLCLADDWRPKDIIFCLREYSHTISESSKPRYCMQSTDLASGPRQEATRRMLSLLGWDHLLSRACYLIWNLPPPPPSGAQKQSIHLYYNTWGISKSLTNLI